LEEPDNNPNQSDEEEEDGRIMAYLEKKVDTARDEKQDKKAEESFDSFEEGSVIEKAMKKFLGGFKELKSEFAQMKETVRSNGSRD
jgi:hypothetical protein